MLFTYRRTVAERRAAGELRDVSIEGKGVGFRWPLAVTGRLWSDVETIPAAYRRTETVRQRWQHLFLLASPAAAQAQRDGKQSCEINVVLRTTDRPGPQPGAPQDVGAPPGKGRSGDGEDRVHSSLQRRMNRRFHFSSPGQVGRERRIRKCYLAGRFPGFPCMSSRSSAPAPDDDKADRTPAASAAAADQGTRTPHPLVVRLVEYRQAKVGPRKKPPSVCRSRSTRCAAMSAATVIPEGRTPKRF